MSILCLIVVNGYGPPAFYSDFPECPFDSLCGVESGSVVLPSNVEEESESLGVGESLTSASVGCDEV